jgi:hypothetical protein
MLADTIDAVLPNDQWFTGLSDPRQPEVKRLHEQKIADDFDTRLIDCTTLSDKSRSSIDTGPIKLGLPSQPGQAPVWLINNLRNRLNHGLPPSVKCVTRCRTTSITANKDEGA